MKTFDEMLAKQMKDEEFKKEYEAIQPEMDVIRAIVDARTSQNLTRLTVNHLLIATTHSLKEAKMLRKLNLVSYQY